MMSYEEENIEQKKDNKQSWWKKLLFFVATYKIVSLFLILIFFIILLLNFNSYLKFIIYKHIGYLEDGPLLNFARISTSAYKLQNGKTLIIGGDGGEGEGYNISNKAELYDPSINKFIKIDNTHFFHRKKTYFFEKNNKVFLLDDNPIEVFELDKNTFSNTKKCILDTNCNKNIKYIYTSFKVITYSKYILLQQPNKIILYDIDTGNSVLLPKFNVERNNFEIFILKNNKLLIFGGYNKRKEFINEVELYDPRKNKFLIVTKLDIIPPIIYINQLKKEFFTKNYKYVYDEKNNIFKSYNRMNIGKNNIELILNDDFSLLYKKCNIFYCPMSTSIYDKKENKIHLGPNLLYRPTTKAGIIEIDNHKFLIYNNINVNSEQPILNTQILTIGKENER